jgi:hypothetical protein
MNKLKKVGLSALAGSLVAISPAYAAEAATKEPAKADKPTFLSLFIMFSYLL